MKRAPIRDILWLFFITRLMLILVPYIAYILLTSARYSSMPVDLAALFGSWNHWDAANYVRIAQFGYQTPYDVAFFPLLPLLTAILSFPFGHGSTLLIATLISNAALLGSLFVIYQLATDMGGDEVAHRTLLYICIFPTAFYFFAPYNEALFLLLSSSTFLAMRRQKWWVAGLLGMFAALSRSAGLLLVIPYLYEVWATRSSIAATHQKMLLRVAPIILIPLGTALYGLYCWHISGNFFDFASVQSHWGRQTIWPWQGIVSSFVDLYWQPFGSSNEVHLLLDLSATIGFIILAVLGWRKQRTSYTIWLAVLLLYILLSPTLNTPDPLESNQRFVLEMFPAFITLAILGVNHPRLHQVVTLIFPVLLATLSVIFIMNLWMV